MCLGIPAQITGVDTSHADLVEVDMAGERRMVNIGVLDEPRAPAIGDWILVHMGFALSIISEEEAREALAVFDHEREALAGLMMSEQDR
jgi:hydrogenase expression/formation protein HypC